MGGSLTLLPEYQKNIVVEQRIVQRRNSPLTNN